MKTTSRLRIFIAIVTMIVIACSEPDIATSTNPGPPPVQPTEYYTSVASWSTVGRGTFTGMVPTQPYIDLSKAAVFIVTRGYRVPIGTQPDAYNRLEYLAKFDGYFYATVDDNVLVLNFVGKTTATSPPFPLEVIILY